MRTIKFDEPYEFTSKTKDNNFYLTIFLEYKIINKYKTIIKLKKSNDGLKDDFYCYKHIRNIKIISITFDTKKVNQLTMFDMLKQFLESKNISFKIVDK